MAALAGEKDEAKYIRYGNEYGSKIRKSAQSRLLIIISLYLEKEKKIHGA